MNRMPITMILWLLLATGFAAALPSQAAGESVPQERLAYLELTRVRALSQAGADYRAYREALERARQYVELLPDGSSVNADLLRKALAYYERSSFLWARQVASDFPVDSLRTDEPDGASILEQCPDVARFRYKFREQIYVKNALECIWGKAAALLDQAPSELR